jgi:dihydrolipoamide dehydrogenase
MPPPTPTEILARIRQVKESWNAQQQAELAALGVQVERATAVFNSATTIALQDGDGKVLGERRADAIIVATGSVPIFLPHMKPNGRQIVAPRFASALQALPASMLVVGAGATGAEFAYLFNRLGVEVTWVVDEFGVLPGFDREAVAFLVDLLAQRGVRVLAGQRVARMEVQEEGVTAVFPDGTAHVAQQAFLAVGRKPDVASLNLAAAGLDEVRVDEYGRSLHQPHIYFAGDVTGPPMIANKALAQAWVAGQHAAGLRPTIAAPQTIIRAIYTEPQVAEVGQVTGAGLATVTSPFTATLKAHLVPEGQGFVKIGYAVGNGRITGATVVGPHAADIIAPIAVALQGNLTLAQFGALYAAYPTITEPAFIAARLAPNQPHP